MGLFGRRHPPRPSDAEIMVGRLERHVDEAARVARREALRAYERAVDARRDRGRDRTAFMALDTDEAIEAEAVRICREPCVG